MVLDTIFVTKETESCMEEVHGIQKGWQWWQARIMACYWGWTLCKGKIYYSNYFIFMKSTLYLSFKIHKY